jgi:penicillin V acylase-like amidase (Ntn superfamily)
MGHSPPRALVCAVIFGAFVASVAEPCTTFCVESTDGVRVGKNYDWDTGVGMLMVNKRGMSKVSMSAVNPARWTSRYGSVTFNQYGREFPAGGINEAGVVVELMGLAATEYPSDLARPGVGVLDWIQYQLDTAGSVAQVVTNAATLRIEGEKGLHYLACDRSGACAAIEFLAGRPVVHTGATLPIPTLTNDTYDASLAFARGHIGFGGTAPIPPGEGSLERFVRASYLAGVDPDANVSPIERVFGILRSVAQTNYTQWSIAYDLGAGEVTFRTAALPTSRHLNLHALDFDCTTPVLVLDLRQNIEGDVLPGLRDYSPEANRALVFQAFRESPALSGISDADIEATAAHPESTVCVGPSR